jgi:fibronectin-binding autotransporter adhesin
MSLFILRRYRGRAVVRADILTACSTALALLLLLSEPVRAAADGADGTGHDGVTGGHGEDGLSGGHYGGNGGDGVSLVYTDPIATAVSSHTYINADTTDLTAVAGINNGDQFGVIVGGIPTVITIHTGDTLRDLAAAIDEVISPYGMSATITVDAMTNDQLLITTAGNFLDVTIANYTGSPFSATGIRFTDFPGALGNAARPFSHGGSGGNGGAGLLMGDGNWYLAANADGGHGGAGGSSDYFYGNGGQGGHGGAGIESTSADDMFTFFSAAEVVGGDGGNGGDGGAEGIGGNGGDGGDGFRAESGSTIVVTSGALIAGGAGGLGGTGGTPGSDGVGGYGITGSNLDVTLAGTVNAGANQPTAIHLAGGDNRLTLENGYSLGGNVQANGSNDVLALGGGEDAAFDTDALGGVFQGFELFEKADAATWTLTGGVSRDWWVREGTLAGSAETLAGNIQNDAHVFVSGAGAGLYEGVISGSGSVGWGGSQTIVHAQGYTGLTHILGAIGIESADTFSGDILIDSGYQLTVGDAGATAPVHYAGHISGQGDVVLAASNVVWSADHSLTGKIFIDQGAGLSLGTGGGTGAIVGDVVFRGVPGTLDINRAGDYHYDGVIAGSGNLIKQGTGNYVLSADHSLSGAVTVNAGGMLVNGAMDGATATVSSGGLLGGGGSLGTTVVHSGGTLAPGDGLGTLTINGDLTLQQGSLLNVDVGAPGSDFSTPGQSDSVTVNGNLAINGAALNLNDAGGFGAGLYRLFDYSGTYSESHGGLQLASPDPSLSLQHLAADKHINLINTAGMTLHFWNANGQASGSTQGGGSGVWTATSAHWTDATGSVTAPMNPAPGFAVFAGEAGTVTVSDADGVVHVEGMQFASDGYQVTGDGVALAGTDGEIRVGDGSAASSDYVATITSVLSGTNGLRKTGEGTLRLHANNDYDGDTAITAGTLSVLSADALGQAGSRVVLNGGALHLGDTAGPVLGRQLELAEGGGTLRNDALLDVHDDLSGAGRLTKQGNGTLALHGNNDFSGGLVVAEGVVQGAAGALGVGHIENNGLVRVVEAGQAQLGNDLSGAGVFSLSGNGALRLTGDNGAFDGRFRIEQGTLMGDAGSFGTAEIENEARLVLDQSAEGVFGNLLSGTGDVEKTGTGTLSLESDATAFTGNIRINQGRANVNGNWSNSVFTVNDGGVLGGVGQLGSTTVMAGGTLAPGHALGTLSIHGDLTFNAGSRLALEVDPAGTGSDHIAVTGQAILSGSAVHVGNNGVYQPFSRYTFLHATGGIVGQFDDVSSDFAFLDASLTYTADTVSLELLRNDQRFASAAQTLNQRAVANNVDSLDSSHDIYRHVVKLDAEQAAATFDNISGDSLLAGLSAGRALQQRFAAGVRQRGREAGVQSAGGLSGRLERALQALAAPSNPYAQAATATPDAPHSSLADSNADTQHGVWVRAQSSHFEEDQQGNVGNATYRFRGDQLTLGVDQQWSQGLLGLAVGRADGTLDFRNRQADAEVSAWFSGLYGRWNSGGPWYLRGDLSYGSSDVSQQRIVSGMAAESDSTVKTWRLAMESGWDLTWGETGLHPYGMVVLERSERNGFAETGGGIFALSVEDSEQEGGEIWLGADLSRAVMPAGKWMLAEAGLALVQPFGDTQAQQRAHFAGSNGFSVYCADQDDLQLAVHAGAELYLTPAVSVWLGYQGRFGGDTQSQGALLSASLAW